MIYFFLGGCGGTTDPPSPFRYSLPEEGTDGGLDGDAGVGV